jgi:hypothetical protein
MFGTLKKRQPGVFRAVPVPPALLDAPDLVHGIREAQARRGKGRGENLWPWSRMTGWRAVHAISCRPPASTDRRPRPRASGTASASPPSSPPASRSTWCRNGSATPSSPPQLSAPTPLARGKGYRP